MMDYTNTEEYIELNRCFKEAFGKGIPLMMIPETETLADLTDKVNKCIKVGKNLLSEFYGWEFDGNKIY